MAERRTGRSRTGSAEQGASTQAQDVSTEAEGAAASAGSTVSSAADKAFHVVAAPVNAVADLLPDSSVPVLLGAGALAVAGVVDWPVAVGIGLGYYALRRWR